MNKKASVELIALGVVAVIALGGLVLLFSKGEVTGQYMGSWACTDTERGDINVYHKGTVTYAGGEFTDTCADNLNNAVAGAGPKLIEYYCKGGAMFTKTMRCVNGCVNGACVV
ncbi:MAG: hypothetical protein QXM31_02560 [Candidatus Woesearchaeota archaeon]